MRSFENGRDRTQNRYPLLLVALASGVPRALFKGRGPRRFQARPRLPKNRAATHVCHEVRVILGANGAGAARAVVNHRVAIVML